LRKFEGKGVDTVGLLNMDQREKRRKEELNFSIDW
jgi:hypothetical protein